MSTILRRLGQYEIQQQLGRGSKGEVWKAHDLSQHRDIAIKILHTDLQADPNFITRFTTEGKHIAALHHSNIVQVHEVNVTRPAQSNETTAYIASDYIIGETLTSYLSTTSHKGAFPDISEIVYLFTSLGVAIDYAHQQGIVHGNIKPGNILLNKQNTNNSEVGEPMITDFGLERLLGSAGTNNDPLYMSPEQAQGFPASNRSDVYALGIILYETCTGVLPFRDESSVAVMMQHISTLPTPPTLINPNVPSALSEVILRALAKDPASRFAMASLLATALADACSMQDSIHIKKNTNANEEANAQEEISPPILGVSQLRRASSPFTSQPLPAVSGPLPPTSGPLVSGPLPTFSGKYPVSATMPTVPITPAASSKVPFSSQITQVPLPLEPTLTPARATLSSQTMEATPSSKYPTISSKMPVPIQPARRELTPLPTMGPPPSPIASLPKTRRLKLTASPIYVVIAVLLLLLIVLGTAIVSSLALNRTPPAGGNGLGHIFFQDDALGHNDQLRIEIQNIPGPPTGKSYFAWLQDTTNNNHALGELAEQNGSITYLYQGDSQHTNLLSTVQSIFITLEDSGSQPQSPTGSKVYQAALDTAVLQDIRNILYVTPGLPDNQAAVAGMLDTIKSMNDKAQSVVDSTQGGHDYSLARRQATRIIEMVDGSQYAASSGDRPAHVPSQLKIAIGLLSSPTQTGYIDALDKQLDNLKQAAANDPTVLQHVQNAKNAIADLRDWIQKIRSYDVQILKAANLANPAIIGVALQLKKVAADSYTGRTIPPNESPLSTLGSAGAIQAYNECQYMAQLNVQTAS